MKKIVSAIITVAILILTPCYCLADSSYSIEELGFSILFPSDLYVITQDTEASSSVWTTLGLDPAVSSNYLKNNDIYINAFAPDFTYEIVVVCKKGQNYREIFNLNLYKDADIRKNLSRRLYSGGESLGIKVFSEEIYKSGDIKFCLFSGTQTSDGQTVYFKSYLTVVNGISVQITLRSYDGVISNQQETLIKSVADSIRFKQILSKPNASSQSTHGTPLLYKALVGGLSVLIVSFFGFFVKKIKASTNHKSQEDVNCSCTQEMTSQIIPLPKMDWRQTKTSNPTSETPSMTSAVNKSFIISGEEGFFLSPENREGPIAHDTSSTSIPNMNNPPIQFCDKCGARLERNSRFCSECGAEIASYEF